RTKNVRVPVSCPLTRKSLPAPREELSRKRPDNECCTLSQVDCTASQDRLWWRAYTTVLPVTASHNEREQSGHSKNRRSLCRLIQVQLANSPRERGEFARYAYFIFQIPG